MVLITSNLYEGDVIKVSGSDFPHSDPAGLHPDPDWLARVSRAPGEHVTLAGERHFVGAAAADLDHPVSPEAGHHLRTEHIITRKAAAITATN